MCGRGTTLGNHLIEDTAAAERHDPGDRLTPVRHLDRFPSNHASDEHARVLAQLTDSRSNHGLHCSTLSSFTIAEASSATWPQRGPNGRGSMA